MSGTEVDVHAQTRAEPRRLPAAIPWAALTTLGYALGMTLSTYVAGLLRPLGPVLAGVLNVLIYGAVLGACLGAAQFAAMPRGLAPFLRWILASLAGTALGFAAAAVAGEALGNWMDPARNVVLGEGAVAAVAGALIGLVAGLAQWLVLRRRLRRARGWLVAGTLGTAAGSLLAAVLLGLFELDMLRYAPALSVGACLGIAAGTLQGLVFRASKSPRSWASILRIWLRF